MNVPAKFEVHSFTRSSDNRGYPKNGKPLNTPTLSFLHNFLLIFITAKCTLVHLRGLGIACRPSVCPSVRPSVCDVGDL